jgi:hypothetical protein
VDENRNILHLLYKHPPVNGESEKCDVSTSHGEYLKLTREIKIRQLMTHRHGDDGSTFLT